MGDKKILALPNFSVIGVSEDSDGKVVVLRLNLSPEEYATQSPAVQKILGLTLKEKEEVERYLHLDQKSKQIIDAFVIANNVLYFDDSSDYGTALWQICSKLNPTAFPEEDDNMYVPMYIKRS